MVARSCYIAVFLLLLAADAHGQSPQPLAQAAGSDGGQSDVGLFSGQTQQSSYAAEGFYLDDISQEEIALAMFQQPAPRAAAPRAPTTGSRSANSPPNTMLASSNSTQRWEQYTSRPARVFGDQQFNVDYAVLTNNGLSTVQVSVPQPQNPQPPPVPPLNFPVNVPDYFVSIPVSVSGGRLSVADNNMSLPDDRVFFIHSQFSNALLGTANDFAQTGPRQDTPFSVGRYTFGLEKTFYDSQASIQIQVPFIAGDDYLVRSRPNVDMVNPNDPNDRDFSGIFITEIGSNLAGVGNLQLIGKAIIDESPGYCLAAGIGLNLPTGGSITGFVRSPVPENIPPDTIAPLPTLTRFRVRNEAAQLVPFIAYLYEPNSQVFNQGFFQLDVPTIGNAIEVNGVEVGRTSIPTILRVNQSLGVWLSRNLEPGRESGLAALVELHYSTALQEIEPQVLNSQLGNLGDTLAAIGNFDGRDQSTTVSQLNLSTGIHVDLRERIELRVGTSIPLLTGSNRGFDSELMVQINGRF